MKCPNCKLENMPSSQRSDCGYDFQLGTLKTSFLKGKEAADLIRNSRTARLRYIFALFLAVVSAKLLLLGIGGLLTIRPGLLITLPVYVGCASLATAWARRQNINLAIKETAMRQ